MGCACSTAASPGASPPTSPRVADHDVDSVVGNGRAARYRNAILTPVDVLSGSSLEACSGERRRRHGGHNDDVHSHLVSFASDASSLPHTLPDPEAGPIVGENDVSMGSVMDLFQSAAHVGYDGASFSFVDEDTASSHSLLLPPARSPSANGTQCELATRQATVIV